MANETWKPIPGYENRYDVSNLGRVRSLRGTRGRLRPVPHLLKPAPNPQGYPTVVLGRGNTRTVHSLVALAFIGPRPEGQECRHINGNRADPRAANLIYGTRGDNIRDAVAHGTWHSDKRWMHWFRQGELMKGNWRGHRR